jgi:threonine/homoserine/homoserine lactone efflux protein
MENLALIFVTSLGIGLTGAVMPGPLLALTLKESLSRGKWSALWLASGHSFLELLMVGALVGGLSRLVSADAIAGPVGLLGGAILLWMGVGAIRQTRGGGRLIDDSASPNGPHSLLVSGAAVTIANPYWTAWWLTAGLALVLFAAKAGLVGIVVFYLGHISADFLWFGLVGLVVGSGRRMLEAKLYRHMLQACGAFLLLFGLLFVGYGGRLIHSTLVR